MKTVYRNIIVSSCLFFFLLTSGSAFCWNDRTHIAIAKAAGYSRWYDAAGADMTKLKAGQTESTNHWSDNTGGVKVTEAAVMDQVKLYNKASDTEGHLYGAIIASLRNYIADRDSGKYGEYHLAFCAHYIGDLGMPLHNVRYDDFNEKHHATNDGIVEAGILNNTGLIRKKMYSIVIRNERDLAGEIARIANIARGLAKKMMKENRDMTQAEAYTELGHSASLLKAVLTYTKAAKHRPVSNGPDTFRR